MVKTPENPENLDQHKKGSDHSSDHREAKNKIENKSKQERLALQESLQSLIKNESPSDSLDASDWLGKKEQADKETSSPEMHQRFDRGLESDHVTYFSGRKADRPLGKNSLKDVGDLGIGAVDSLASTAQLAGHFVVDAGKILLHPIREFTRTQDILERNIV